MNVRTLTTHIGFVRMAVTAPKQRRGHVRRVSLREVRSMRTRFGRVEEILGGGKRLVGRFDGCAVLELVIT